MGNYVGRYLELLKPKRRVRSQTTSVLLLPPPAQVCLTPQPMRSLSLLLAQRLYPQLWGGAPRISGHLHRQRVPRRRPFHTLWRSHPPCSWKTHLKRRQWAARCRMRSPVRVRISPPGCKGIPAGGRAEDSLYTLCPEQLPDPRREEDLLQALRQCKKGKRKVEDPLGGEAKRLKLEQKWRLKRRQYGPQARGSAFRLVVKDGEGLDFQARPGPLRTGGRSWICSLCEEWLDPQPPTQLPPSEAQPSLPATQSAPGHTSLIAPMAPKKPERVPIL